MFKSITKYATVLLFALVLAKPAAAQWGIGASYEIREESPKNGFGLRLERDIKLPVPLVFLGTRAHFSYFSDENSVTGNGVTYSRDIKNYDFGLAAYGGVSLGLLKPYVGLGLGSETYDVNYKDAQTLYTEGSDSKLFYNAFVGAALSPIPMLDPFIEYRFSDVGSNFKYSNINKSNGRLIFGVTLRF